MISRKFSILKTFPIKPINKTSKFGIFCCFFLPTQQFGQPNFSYRTYADNCNAFGVTCYLFGPKDLWRRSARDSLALQLDGLARPHLDQLIGDPDLWRH
jgi:hypothetical protein